MARGFDGIVIDEDEGIETEGELLRELTKGTALFRSS